jgi:hypothetical protein
LYQLFCFLPDVHRLATGNLLPAANTGGGYRLTVTLGLGSLGPLSPAWEAGVLKRTAL